MDPDATLAMIRDDSADLADRLAAALELAEWRSRGGYLPANMSAENVAALGTLHVDACVLIGALQ